MPPLKPPGSAGMETVIWAPAKINLTLDILGRRPDGYHEVATVYQTIGLCDRLSVALSVGDREPRIDVLTDDPTILGGPGNLAHRAVGLLLETVGVGPAVGAAPTVEVRIQKAIPAAAGLGGGSSDAAAALLAVNRLLGAPLTDGQLEKLAGRLGADVTFFIRGGTALGRGRGEIIEPLPDAPPLFAVLAAAGHKPSTAAVYVAHDARPPAAGNRPIEASSLRAVAAIRAGDVAALCAAIHNDLAGAARMVAPEIAQVERALEATGAMAVAVCGAGPTVFALYPGRQRADQVRAYLAALFPWVAVAPFIGEGRRSPGASESFSAPSAP